MELQRPVPPVVEIHESERARIAERPIEVEALVMLPHEAVCEWIPVREKQVQ
jgi:hypothetical protein